MQLLIHVSKAAAVAIFMVSAGGCVAEGGALDHDPDRIHIDIDDFDIGGAQMVELRDKPLAVRSRIGETAYGTLALYPSSKFEGESDAGKCIDLVYSTRLKGQLVARRGALATLNGYFVFVDRLPDYTTVLVVDGLRHVPVCQVFSTISPYPYFVVDAVE